MSRAAVRYGPLEAVLADVATERAAQDARWGPQDPPDGTGPAYAGEADALREACGAAFRDGAGSWRHILAEEVAEAFAEDDPDRLRAELVQVAAVAVKWIQALDGRPDGDGSGRSRPG
ncbi:MAG: hypothetical protein ACJ73S_06445 [Mycobacteriales bacterium]